MFNKINFRMRAFTLIELLIVVAIIAILAAIAVPNFLEAQTRSKVARCAADMRSLRTAIESYRVDNNKYPETDIGETDIAQPGVGMYRLTTPLSYMTSVPKSPFKEQNLGYPGFPDPANQKNANREQLYLWVNAKHNPGYTTDSSPADGLDDSYQLDRVVYLAEGNLAKTLAERIKGEWMLKSVGPDNLDNRDDQQLKGGVTGTDARVYDPTNGTVSAGDIVVFSDSSGFASPR